MKRIRITTGIVLIALAVSSCKKEESAPEPVAPADTAAAATDPALAAAANPVDFDMRAFAGTFSGTGVKIELSGDGTYTVDETDQGKQTGNSRGDGHWTAEEGGARLRLDPNSKSDEDRLFAIAGKDELRPLDKDGNAVDGASSLKRASR